MEFTRRQCLGLLSAGLCNATEDTIIEQWRRIAMDTDGVVGAAALHIGSGRSISLHGSDRFPLASVCKLPIAMNILAMVDEGKLSLNDDIEIPLQDLVPGVSAVAERWPKQKRFPLNELLELMVAKSDNTAVQTLFRIGGGGTGMAARFRQWQTDGIRVDRSERQCGLDAAGVKSIPPVSQWTPGMFEELTAKITPHERVAAMRRFLADPRDTATPNGTVQLLQTAFRGELLSAGLTTRLIEILTATTTGSMRIKGLLPEGTVVAHKTGTTSTVSGLNGATNDVGVIMLPNRAGRLALAVYVKGSTDEPAATDRVIARIARSAFDSALNLPERPTPGVSER
jgi:beta-lactamase class A